MMMSGSMKRVINTKNEDKFVVIYFVSHGRKKFEKIY